jgi:hypothetical protein
VVLRGGHGRDGERTQTEKERRARDGDGGAWSFAACAWLGFPFSDVWRGF